MSAKRFHIEVEVDNIDSKEREDAVTEAIRIAARQAFTSCLLILGDNPLPLLTIWGEDLESGRTNIKVGEDE